MNDELQSYIDDMYLSEKLINEILDKIYELKYGLHKSEDALCIVINEKQYLLLLKYYKITNLIFIDDKRTVTKLFGVLLKQGFVETPVVGLR